MYPFDLRLFEAQGASDGGTAEHTQSHSAHVEDSADGQETRESRYRELLREYKDLDDRRMQETIKKRLKNVGQVKRQFDTLNQAVQPLYQRHGIAPGDVDALSQAIQSDGADWERGAQQAGMTVAEYEQMAQTARLHNAAREQAVNEQIAAWHAEAQALQQQYPDFDLMQEIKNPLFASLISSRNTATRLSLKAAYEACHVEEMRQMAAKQAAKAAEANALHSIRAGAHRPREAGSGMEAAVTPGKIDITRLTRSERRELERRAEWGERITFQEGSWKF